MSLEPRGYDTIAYTLAVTVIVLMVSAWFVPGPPFEIKVSTLALGVAAGVMLVATFLWIHRHEQGRGPLLIIRREEGILLRDGVRIPFNNFLSFEITRGWEDVGDTTKVSHLVLRRKTGEETEVLACMYHREVVKLKETLDTKIRELSGLEFGIGS